MLFLNHVARNWPIVASAGSALVVLLAASVAYGSLSVKVDSVLALRGQLDAAVTDSHSAIADARSAAKAARDALLLQEGRDPKSLPIGTIIMWHGNPKDKPPGYEPCDGEWDDKLARRRPDMQGRFPRGARKDVQALDQLSSGGTDSVPLPHHTHQVPAHAHGAGSLFALWGYRIGSNQDSNIFQFRGKGDFSGGVGRGFGGQFQEGENSKAQATGVAVDGSTDLEDAAITAGPSDVSISIVPCYQEFVFLIRVE